MSRYRGYTTCPDCGGSRLRPEALYIRVGDKNLAELVRMNIAEAKTFFDGLHLSPEETQQLEDNLRGLSVGLKRDGETDEQAFERVKASKYLIEFKHDAYWPFYHVEHKFGRILLTLNTGHPFYSRLYEPLRQFQQSGPHDAEEDRGQTIQIEKHDSPIVALELLLLSLARAQSALSMHNDDARRAFDSLRREWSDTYRIQLGT